MSHARVPKKLVVAFALYCLWLGGTAVIRSLETWSDSERYLPPSSILAWRQPRILTTALYSLVSGNHVAIVLTQIFLYGAAWIFLAVALFQNIGGRLGTALALFALAYSLTYPLVSWQWMGVSEGLAITSLVFWIASILKLLVRAGTVSNTTLNVNPIACMFLALVRPQLLIIGLPIQIAVVASMLPFRSRTVAWGAWLLVGFASAWSLARLAALTFSPSLNTGYAGNNVVGKASYRE